MILITQFGGHRHRRGKEKAARVGKMWAAQRRRIPKLIWFGTRPGSLSSALGEPAKPGDTG